MTKSSRPIFLLGLGAQKAGTTWLHAYISQFSTVDTGRFKEYHIWDCMTVPGFAETYLTDKKKLGLRRNLRDAKNRLLRRPREGFFLRREMQRNPEYYFDYFSGLLARDGIQLTADITPSYSALQVETLVSIRDGFAQRGIDTKVIFLMRDPVERCLSAIRMYRRAGLSPQDLDITKPDEEVLRSYISSRGSQLRTNYHNTLSAMDDVFAPEDIHVGAYETMFSKDEIDRLSEFLGLEAKYNFVDKHFNTTQKNIELDPKLLQDAIMAFAPVYDYCFKRYPELKPYWHDFKASGEMTP